MSGNRPHRHRLIQPSFNRICQVAPMYTSISYTRMLWSMPLTSPNGISINSAVFYTIARSLPTDGQTDIQTERRRNSTCKNRPLTLYVRRGLKARHNS